MKEKVKLSLPRPAPLPPLPNTKLLLCALNVFLSIPSYLPLCIYRHPAQHFNPTSTVLHCRSHGLARATNEKYINVIGMFKFGMPCCIAARMYSKKM